MQITATSSATAETVIYLFRQDDTLADRLSFFANALLLTQDFKADAGQTVVLYEESQKTFLVGLGKTPKEADFIKVLRSFFYKQKQTLPNHIALHLAAGSVETQWIEAIVNGSLLGNYELGLYKTDAKKAPDFFERDTELQIVVLEAEVELAKEAIEIGEATAQTQMQIMDLMNAPANKKSPQKLGDWAVESGKKYGYSVQVFDENQCAELKLEALLAVGQGSVNPPRLLLLEYIHPQATRKVGLVGKGVTFDTGGISIKPSANMHYMKSDMGGAAAVLGTLELAAKLQLPVHLIGVIPTTENSVDGLAMKPGDVIGSYAGKTIEVIDTDAEGRLILADGLAYLNRNYAPDVLIDLATLTGSVIGTLGYVAAGLFCNNDQLSAQLQAVGQKTGEKLWPLPIWDDYQDELKSDVADLKNYHGKPFAGAIVAAKFLEVFTEKHLAWAHLDIAGTAFADSEFGSQKSATAYGVRLLTKWLRG